LEEWKPPIRKPSPESHRNRSNSFICAVSMWAPVAVWLLAIFIVSAQPTLPQLEQPLADRVLKAVSHAMEYAVLGYLLWRPMTDRGRKQDLRVLAIPWFLCCLYAMSDEYHQSFVPGRVADWADVAADAIGASAALAVLRRGKVARLARKLETRIEVAIGRDRTSRLFARR